MSKKQPNFIIFMTDQQRTIQHFPKDWVKKYLPNYQFFLDNGAYFENNICNTTPCGPSRASLFTGMYPAKNGIMDNKGTVDPKQMNFANILNDAGYDVYYKGKLHMVKEFTLFSQSWTSEITGAPKDAENETNSFESKYGIKEWTSPDFGTALVGQNPTSGEIATMAGGSGHNDNRVVTGEYKMYSEQQSVLEFLNARKASKSKTPFCLVVSLLNPHDVSLYPYGWQAAGYQNALFQNMTDIQVPISYSKDSLADKPQVQAAYLNELGGQLLEEDATNYARFYAYLHTLSDALLGTVKDVLDDDFFEDSILVRMADHGEMGMAHGGLQEKMFTAYNEAIKVPMIWYNSKLFKPGKRSQMVSLIDFVPTIASLAGVENVTTKYKDLQGEDYSKAISNPSAKFKSSLLFNYSHNLSNSTYDKGSSNLSVTPNPCTAPSSPPKYKKNPNAKGKSVSQCPANIYAIITETGWKYAVYFDILSGDPTPINTKTAQFELYNENNDKHEITNLLPVNGKATSENLKIQEQLHVELTQLMKENGIVLNGWDGWKPWKS